MKNPLKFWRFAGTKAPNAEMYSVINPCFPRSGHRYLRNLCSAYFGDDFKFASVYQDQSKDYDLKAANYIKHHDLKLGQGKPGMIIRPNQRYVVQYRHPLLSLASYFDFCVHHGWTSDTRRDWDEFLTTNMLYWTKFVEKWCLADEVRTSELILAVDYRDLVEEPRETLRRVVKFASAKNLPVDEAKLDDALSRHSQGFARYVEHESTSTDLQTKKRDLREFRYFDETFLKLEQSIRTSYLDPLNIPPELDT